MVLNLRRACVVSIIFFVLLGLAYPLAETGVAQALLGHQASGSLTSNGSTLVGQHWSGPRWFQGRPDGDDPTATGGSNLGPHSQALLAQYRKRIAALEKLGITPTPDLVSASGSGVDPDISPGAALAQVTSVARARGLAAGRVRSLVVGQVHGPQFGFLGSSYVNVLDLNVALSALP
jgi:K+-transporting ATPase ATPase C chain